MKKHGLRKHPFYDKYYGMMQRCHNSKHKAYSRYGGRGIRVEPFLQKLQNCITYLESLPNAYKEGLSLDRINNEKGYERGNLRWATIYVQQSNMKNNNKYIGVSPKLNRFRAILTHKSKNYHVGSFKTPEEAVIARNKFIVEGGYPHLIQNIHNEIEF